MILSCTARRRGNCCADGRRGKESRATTKVKIKQGTSSGTVMRLRGKGVRTAKKTGDLLITVQVAVPRRLSSQARTALEAFDAAMESDPRETLRQEAAT